MIAISQKGTLEIMGLNSESFQCDSIVKDIFRNLGVDTQILAESIRIKRKGKVVKKLIHDFSNYPDLIPAVVTTCVCMEIPFKIGGIDSLRHKESDRIMSLQAELAKIGANLTIENQDGKETLTFDGRIKLKGLKQLDFDTHNDHRMALALTPICLKGIPITIENPWVTNKSYTTFWDDLKKVGFEVIS
jgi:3-phosphoshikimate 1-carboxyvinyltransferase